MRRVRDRSELERLIEGIPGRTLAAKLRRLMPQIDRRIQEGVRHQEIVDTLNQHGGLGTEVKLRTLRTYLARFRRAQREGTGRHQRRPAGRPTKGERGEERRGPPSAPVVEAAVVAAALPVPGGNGTSGPATPSVLRQSRNEDVDLEALAELGKPTPRKKGAQTCGSRS